MPPFPSSVVTPLRAASLPTADRAGGGGAPRRARPLAPRASAALVLGAALALLCACSSSDAGSPAAAQEAGGAAGAAGAAGASGGQQAGGAAGAAPEGPPSEGAYDETPVGGARPVKVYVPGNYKQGEPRPLVILLHGYGASGAVQELLFGLEAQADLHGFLYAHPDGTFDKDKKRFWNATDACCNFDGATVDDSAYLRGLIDEIGARFPLDPKRIYFVGHSNGGFMSHRMACEHADVVAAIGSLAGAMYADPAKCAASQPVSALQIHGTSDETIDYEGQTIQGVSYPSAMTTTEDWAKVDGCSLEADTSSPPLDLDASIDGAETTVRRYGAGCKPGGHAELWSIAGGKHVPSLNQNFAPALVDFLLAHPKP
jgi:polyhydroxybutyrate depolymerase